MGARAQEKEKLRGEATRVLAVAEKLIDAGQDKVCLDQLAVCLKAVRRYWDKEQKDWVEEPDYPVILKAVELGLAYLFGKPAQRNEVLSLTASIAIGADGSMNLDEIKDEGLRNRVSQMISGSGRNGHAVMPVAVPTSDKPRVASDEPAKEEENETEKP
jgi:hypothetical protein